MTKKKVQGHHTKRNVWDEAAALEVVRGGETLDPGVNYFVLMLDQLGLPTAFSCEGHPDGFYIAFSGPYKAALELHGAGFFSVEVEGHNYWSMRMKSGGESLRIDALRWAAMAWEERLGQLDFSRAVLVS